MAIDAEFRSDFDLRESVARLQAASYRTGQLSRPAEAVVGTVTNLKVNLQRVLRHSSNPKAILLVPFFVGRFEQRPEGVYLAGRFSIPWYSKIIMGLWVGVWLAVAAHRFTSPGHTPNAMLLASPALVPGLALALSVIWIVQGWWRSRTDVQWLSNFISRTIEMSPTPR